MIAIKDECIYINKLHVTKRLCIYNFQNYSEVCIAPLFLEHFVPGINCGVVPNWQLS